MPTHLNPYLSFRDTTRQAMQFYETVFGGTLTMSTFEDFSASEDPAEKDKIMHAQLVTDGGMWLMASDTPNSMELNVGNNFSVSLSGDDEQELRGYWDRLAEGGTITMPLEKAPWGDAFGMLTDRFGVAWLVNIAGGGQQPES